MSKAIEPILKGNQGPEMYGEKKGVGRGDNERSESHRSAAVASRTYEGGDKRPRPQTQYEKIISQGLRTI